MSRTRYTKVVREEQHIQIARKEKEVATVARKLHRQDAESSEVPPTTRAKERRSTRLEQKRRYKAKHRDGAADIDQK